MRLNYNNESMEEWSEKVKEFEMKRAMRLISRGENPEKVVEEFSKRMADKLLHPLYPALFKPVGYDAEASRKSYEDKMNNRGGIADHVSD